MKLLQKLKKAIKKINPGEHYEKYYLERVFDSPEDAINTFKRNIDSSNKQFGAFSGYKNPEKELQHIKIVPHRNKFKIKSAIPISRPKKVYKYQTNQNLISKQKNNYISNIGMPMDMQFSHKIELKPSEIHPNETVNLDHVYQIKKHIKEGGELPPILLDGNYGIIDGHHRLEAAKQLRIKSVPVVFLYNPNEDNIPHLKLKKDLKRDWEKEWNLLWNQSNRPFEKSLNKPETLEDRNLNIYQKEQIFEKAYKNKDLNTKNYEAFDEGKALSIKDCHKDWGDYNSHVFIGLDPSQNITQSIGGQNRTTKVMRVISGPNGKKAIIKAPLDWRELGLMRDKKNEYYQKDLEKYKQKKKDWIKKKEYAEKHGLDFNEPMPEKPKIFALKRLSETSGFLLPNFRTTHREVAFNYLADNVFGLGEYVAKTALFSHPKTKLPWSAQEFIEGQDVSLDLSNISHYKNSGILEKLAVMDIVLGNSDRNISNLKLDSNNQLKLIDNAACFDYAGRFGQNYPAYIKYHLEKAPSLDFHKWLNSIKISNLRDHLNKIKCPKPLLNVALRRLKAIQKWSKVVRNNPNFSQDLAGALDQARLEKIDGDKMIAYAIKQSILNRIKSGKKYFSPFKKLDKNSDDKTQKMH